MKDKTHTIKVFFDMEFTQLKQDSDPISIGLCHEYGPDKFYGEFSDFDILKLDEWLYDNVIPALEMYKMFSSNTQGCYTSGQAGAPKTFLSGRLTMATSLDIWLTNLRNAYGRQTNMNIDQIKIQMWSDCLAYDWVLFCQLFGGALGHNFPKYVSYIPMDICTLFHMKGIDPDINREEFAGLDGIKVYEYVTNKKHNALWDALVIQKCYEKLITL